VVAAGISANAAEALLYASTMKLTIHVLKDARVGLKQKCYMESHLFVGKHTGVINIMNRIDILST
jgi:hypothetical protein